MAKRPAKKTGKKRRQKKNKALALPKKTALQEAAATSVAIAPPIEMTPTEPAPTALSAAAPLLEINQISQATKTPTKSWRNNTLELRGYIQLMRLDRPIGILLLLWPTYWSLWLAAKGIPSIKNLIIFTLGCVLMRSAGCVINDYADRRIDSKVKRTRHRPLATGLVSTTEALLLFAALCVFSLMLVLMTNSLTIKLSIGGLLLAIIYPFMKRVTHMPQVVLGAVFAWSIPMAFSAETAELNQSVWLLYLAVVVWAVIYDTFYAMVDRDDDIRIGVKSTAILFGEADRAITTFLQGLFLFTLVLVGRKFELGSYFYTSLCAVALLFAYQQWLIRDRLPDNCFRAFLNNNYVGLVIFVGIAADYYF